MSARSRGRVVQSSEYGRWEPLQPVSQLRLLGLNPVRCPSVPHLRVCTCCACTQTHPLRSRSAIVVESWLRRAWVVVCACDVCVIGLLFSSRSCRREVGPSSVRYCSSVCVQIMGKRQLTDVAGCVWRLRFQVLNGGSLARGMDMAFRPYAPWAKYRSAT